MTDIKKVLEDREKTHGSFVTHAAVTQSIKSTIELHGIYGRMSGVQMEALDMIAHKIGRIVAGNPDLIDTWRDIAGYAQLVVNHLETYDRAMDVKITRTQNIDGKWVDLD